jgi:hypothetical protein
VEAKLFVKSLGLSLCFLVKIKDLPSLVGSIVSVVYLNSLTFIILALIDIEAFVGLLDVAEVFSLIDEDLPPS